MYIKQVFKFIVPDIVLKIRGVIQKLITLVFILTENYGQRKSMWQWKCLDKDGFEIPWYTYPAIEYLSGLDFSDSVILEFGSGSSSLWWSKRAKFLLAVEHNKDWYEKVSKHKNEKLDIVLAESKCDYLSAGKGNFFDVVIIDGIHRHNCVNVVAEVLKEKGLVILDNSDWHPETARVLREKYDLIQVDFHGFGPINSYTWTTSLFFSREFKCNPKNSRLPGYSAGALKIIEEGQDMRRLNFNIPQSY